MIKLVTDTIDKNDINALIEWLSQKEIPQLTKGKLTRELEKKWAEKIGTKHSIFVNSGSSAILLTLAALRQAGYLKNDNIVVPSLSWATDVSSPMLLGMKPILCDCNLHDLSCDLDSLKKLFIEYKPSAFILVSPLGLVPAMDEIVELCIEHDVILLEDVCESMGSKYNDRYLGSFGFASFFSTYFGHHISTIEGGFINTNDDLLNNALLMMRSHGWTRDIILPKEMPDDARTYPPEEPKFNELYRFVVPGFNLRSTDLQAFLGIRAIDKLDEYSRIRNENFLHYQKIQTWNLLDLELHDTNFISNFAYPVLVENRDVVVKRLRENGVEVRPLIAGNMGTQPMWENKYKVPSLPNSELIDEMGFYLPNHHGLTKKNIEFISNIINAV